MATFLFLRFQLPIPKCSQRTPLHEAVRNNHAEVVRLLVEADADVEAKGEDMITPLLLAGSGVNRNDPQGMERFVEIMKILVSKKWTSNSSRHQFINIIHPHTGTSRLIVTRCVSVLCRDRRNSITCESKEIWSSAKLYRANKSDRETILCWCVSSVIIFTSKYY